MLSISLVNLLFSLLKKTCVFVSRLEQPYLNANASFFEALSCCSRLQRLCLILRSGTFDPLATETFMERCRHVVMCHMFTSSTLVACRTLEKALLDRSVLLFVGKCSSSTRVYMAITNSPAFPLRQICGWALSLERGHLSVTAWRPAFSDQRYSTNPAGSDNFVPEPRGPTPSPIAIVTSQSFGVIGAEQLRCSLSAGITILKQWLIYHDCLHANNTVIMVSKGKFSFAVSRTFFIWCHQGFSCGSWVINHFCWNTLLLLKCQKYKLRMYFVQRLWIKWWCNKLHINNF